MQRAITSYFDKRMILVDSTIVNGLVVITKRETSGDEKLMPMISNRSRAHHGSGPIKRFCGESRFAMKAVRGIPFHATVKCLVRNKLLLLPSPYAQP